jgi:hypothetical protein
MGWADVMEENPAVLSGWALLKEHDTFGTSFSTGAIASFWGVLYKFIDMKLNFNTKHEKINLIDL